MSCPYLTEVTMVYCEVSPVKKLIPSDRVSTASLCEADSYTACPLYREALARHGRILGRWIGKRRRRSPPGRRRSPEVEGEAPTPGPPLSR